MYAPAVSYKHSHTCSQTVVQSMLYFPQLRRGAELAIVYVATNGKYWIQPHHIADYQYLYHIPVKKQYYHNLNQSTSHIRYLQYYPYSSRNSYSSTCLFLSKNLIRTNSLFKKICCPIFHLRRGASQIFQNLLSTLLAKTFTLCTEVDIRHT